MITINNNEKEHIIDMNDFTGEEYVVKVKSVSEYGLKINWGPVIVSSTALTCSVVGDELRIKIDVSNICEEEKIIIKNIKNETAKIIILPNLFQIADKVYIFTIDGYTISKNIVNINIASKVNGIDCPWFCSFEGKPLDFVITPLKCEGGTSVTLSMKSEVCGTIDSCVEFTQQDSWKIIKLYLRQVDNKDISVLKIEYNGE